MSAADTVRMVEEVRRPRALLLDLDDTLLDPSGIPESLMRTFNAVATRCPFLDADQFLAANQAAWAEYWPTVEKSCWLGDVDGASVSLEAWRRTLARCGSEDESIAQFAFETHHLGRDAYWAFDDVRQLLDYAEETGILLGLVTNGPSDLQREKLSCLGISTSFAAIAISGEHRVAKPDPAIFLAALTQLGVEAHEAWHVGDSLDHDIAGAQASGLLAVWVNRNLTPSAGAGLFQPSSPAQVFPDGRPTPDLTVSALGEITALLLEAKP